MAITKEKKDQDSTSDNFATLMAEFGHEAKKIRKVNHSVSFFAKQAEIQSKNVNKIADNSASILTTSLKNKVQGKNKRTLDGLVAGISSVHLREQIKSILKPQDGDDKEVTNKDRIESTVKFHNNFLPVTSSSFTDEEEAELMSESDSEFLPDWSSVGSCATNLSNSPSNFADDELEFNSHTSDVWLLSDEDLDEDNFNDATHMSHNLNIPPPTCGNGSDSNDEPCSSTTPSNASTKLDNKFSCHAIRRVKSMAQDISIDKEIGNDQRVRLLKIKNKNDIGSNFTVPSPLLSREDVTSVKKSPSVTNAKFSLKRSRSNIGVFTQYSRGTYERDVIHEESETDF